MSVIIKEMKKEAKCDICGSEFNLDKQLTLPEAFIDSEGKKVYILCGNCTLALGIEPSPKGVRFGGDDINKINEYLSEKENH